MAQQTAVDWFFDNLKNHEIQVEHFEIYKLAREMEKEQIEEDFIAGEMNNDSHHYTGRKIYQDEHDYYNKTYSNGL
jgi:hypothetical protein